MTKYSFILLLFLVIVSCGNENMTFDIGSKALDIKTNIRYIDSLTVRSYTVMMDSIRTSGLSDQSVLVGNYFDPEFGNITARSYFRVGLPFQNSLPDNAVFDSIRLMLLYNGYSTGDTTATYTINVHELAKTMKPNDDGYFYNINSIDSKPALFGSASLTPKPRSTDTAWIDLNNTFGNELFDLLMNKDDKVSDNQSFLNYFKGFMLDYDASNKAIIGFKFPEGTEVSGNPAMRLYFHYYGYNKVSTHLDFTVQQPDYTLQFNQFTLSDPVRDFPSKQVSKLPAAATDNATYVLAGVGIVTRLEIPYLKNLLELHDNIKIMDAELQLEPVRNTYKTFPLPQKLSLYTSDNSSRFGNSIVDKYGNDQIGYLQIDELYQVETWYTFDVTNFLTSKLAEETDDVPSMLLTVSPDNLYLTLDRLILGSRLNSTNKVKLKIYYMYYE
jgi:hypothetical protein